MFLEVLLQIQAVNYIKLRDVETISLPRKAEKEKLDFLLKKLEQFTTGIIDRVSFVKTLGFKSAAPSDLQNCDTLI